MDTSGQAREQLYGGIAPALSLSDEAFAAYLKDLDRWEGRLEQVIETQLQDGVHYKERPGFNGGPKTRVVNLLGALKLKDVLGLELEWSKKLSRGDGVKTPHLQWEVECRVQSGTKWQQPCVAIADTFESDFRYRRESYQCPECTQKTVLRSLTGGGWYCSRRHGGCGKDFGEFDVQIIHQVRPTVERDDPRELSDLVLQTALARAIRRSVLRSIGRGRVLLVVAEDDDETEAAAAVLIGAADSMEPAPRRSGGGRKPRTDQRDRLRAGLEDAAAATQAQEVPDLQGPLQRASGVVMEREPEKASSNGRDVERLAADTLRLGEHQRAIMEMLGQRRFSAVELGEWAHMVQALPPGLEKLEYEAVLSMPDDVAGQLRALMADQLRCANEQVDALLKVCRSGKVSQERMNEIAALVGLPSELNAQVVRSLDEPTAAEVLGKLEADASLAA